MRRVRVSESRRIWTCEAQSEDVPAEMRPWADQERNPIAIAAFSIGFSDVP